MKKLPDIGWFFALLMFGLLLSVPAKSVFAQKPDTLRPKNILMLFALEPGLPFYDPLLDNIKNKIRSQYQHPVNFYVDYAELSRFNDTTHLSQFFEHINRKYKDTKFDLCVSIGPNLIKIVNKYESPFLDSIPKVFMEFHYHSLDQNYVNHKKNEAGVVIHLEIEKNIQSALSILPGTKNIIVIGGISDGDRNFLELFKLALKDLRNKYNITYLSGLTIPGLRNRLNTLPENSIVFMSTYQKDSTGTIYYTRDVLNLVSEYSKAPIFQLFDILISGSIGGFLLNTPEVGTKIGEISSRILDGESPDSIGIYQSSFAGYIYDWNQLKKWNIIEESLPQGSILVNRERSFYEEYRSYIFTVIIFLVFESLLLIYIISLYRKQKKLSGIIADKDNRYKLLVDHNRLSKLSEFTASLSHELNQPLTAILSSSQASLRYLKKSEIDVKLFEEILGNIVEDVKRASAIILSLRRLIKKDSKDKSRIGVNGIVNEVLLLFRGQSTVQDIIIERENGTEEQYVYADSVLIQQVILNLLLNASEALEKKTGGSRKILLRTKLLDGFVNVSVLDNGPGIPASIKNDIFNPFFTTKNNGMGIGLAICRSIIEDHEGKIQCEDNVSGGAVFTFKLRAVE